MWDSLRNWFVKHFWSGKPDSVVRAQQLLVAIDRGGIPLNPLLVNHIARSLGLEVASSAPMAETIERIRKAMS